MTAARPRGITLIINNASFEHGWQPARHGSEVDVSRVKTLFAALDFLVRTKQDLSRQQLLEELINVTDCQDHSAYDCFVLWLMSYGRSGEVFCSDGNTIHIQVLQDMFSECRTLSGKPKLFFIQASRGIMEDVGGKVSPDSDISSLNQANRSYDSPDSDISSLNQANRSYDSPDSDISSLNQANRSYEPTKGDSVVPKHSDFLYGFSTVDDYVSYSNGNEGSHYVRCFVKAFREHVAHDHILDILTVVNHEVSKIYIQRPSSESKFRTQICKQMPEVRHTLRKKVRF